MDQICDVNPLYLGAGGGEVHHSQRAVLRDQHGLRPDAQGGGPALHHEDGGLELSNVRCNYSVAQGRKLKSLMRTLCVVVILWS